MLYMLYPLYLPQLQENIKNNLQILYSFKLLPVTLGDSNTRLQSSS